jgi:hypothetical protein
VKWAPMTPEQIEELATALRVEAEIIEDELNPHERECPMCGWEGGCGCFWIYFNE